MKKKHRNKAGKHRQIHVIIHFRYWSVSSSCDPSASCSIQVSWDTRCRLSPDEELLCVFLNASWLSQEVPPPSHHLLWRELAHDVGYSCSCYWRILYSSSCYRRILRYRRILLVVSTGAYYPLVATTGGFLLQEDPS